MSQKIFLPIIALSMLLQIAFSFFYNSQIIDQNNLLQQQQQQHQQLLLDNQKLKKELSRLTSLQYLFPLLKNKKVQPINQTLTIHPN